MSILPTLKSPNNYLPFPALDPLPQDREGGREIETNTRKERNQVFLGPLPAGSSLPSGLWTSGLVIPSQAFMLLEGQDHRCAAVGDLGPFPCQSLCHSCWGHSFVMCGLPGSPSTFQMKLANLSYK